MDIVFSGQDMEELVPLLSKDCSFHGPLYNMNSARDYIDSLKADPPVKFNYKIIHSFENSTSAGLFYLFSKPGIELPMAQLFEIKNEKICRIMLIFDSRPFT